MSDLLASFDYYQKTYGGVLIEDENTFNVNCRKASQLISARTLNNVYLPQYKDLAAVKTCACELAESFYDEAQFKISVSSNGGKEISSEKVGEYSVSYATGSNSLMSVSALTSRRNQIISTSLALTGLLYGGSYVLQ